MMLNGVVVPAVVVVLFVGPPVLPDTDVTPPVIDPEAVVV